MGAIDDVLDSRNVVDACFLCVAPGFYSSEIIETPRQIADHRDRISHCMRIEPGVCHALDPTKSCSRLQGSAPPSPAPPTLPPFLSFWMPPHSPHPLLPSFPRFPAPPPRSPNTPEANPCSHEAAFRDAVRSFLKPPGGDRCRSRHSSEAPGLKQLADSESSLVSPASKTRKRGVRDCFWTQCARCFLSRTRMVCSSSSARAMAVGFAKFPVS